MSPWGSCLKDDVGTSIIHGTIMGVVVVAEQRNILDKFSGNGRRQHGINLLMLNF
jgi:hypothetical protein